MHSLTNIFLAVIHAMANDGIMHENKYLIPKIEKFAICTLDFTLFGFVSLSHTMGNQSLKKIIHKINVKPYDTQNELL
jgi:hypothetical protein